MRSSTVLATLFAAVAVASPVHQALHNKRVYEYEVTTEIVTVTVTAGQEKPEIVHVQKTAVVAPQKLPVVTTRSKSSVKPTTTLVISTTTPAPPPPPPTSTTTPPPPPPTTQAPPPPPITTQAPAPVQTTETPAAVVVEQVQQTPEAQQQQQQTQESVQSVPVTPATSSSGNAVKDAALNAHNAYRAKHHAGPVSWDDSLASSAAALAQGCTNKHGMIVGGQNIAAKGFSGQSSPGDASLMTEAVDNWYGEVSMFGSLYGQSSVGIETGTLHFTQVVWKATTKIGCAVNNCGTTGNIFQGFNAYTIVCNYQAAGNFGGQFAANVQAP